LKELSNKTETMSTFLGCLKLETGGWFEKNYFLLIFFHFLLWTGIIVAWTCLLTNLIAALINAEYIIAEKNRTRKLDPETANGTNNLLDKSAKNKATSVFFLLFCIFMIAASFLCIKAVEDVSFVDLCFCFTYFISF
jgi:hypothetical protein